MSERLTRVSFVNDVIAIIEKMKEPNLSTEDVNRAARRLGRKYLLDANFPGGDIHYVFSEFHSVLLEFRAIIGDRFDEQEG